MSDLELRLRNKAADLYNTNGDAMKMWDQIRSILKSSYGGTLPREMFESFIEDIADLMVEGAEALPSTYTEICMNEKCPRGGRPVEIVRPAQATTTERQDG